MQFTGTSKQIAFAQKIEEALRAFANTPVRSDWAITAQQQQTLGAETARLLTALDALVQGGAEQAQAVIDSVEDDQVADTICSMIEKMMDAVDGEAVEAGRFIETFKGRFYNLPK